MKEKLIKWTREEENKRKLLKISVLGVIILLIAELIVKITGLIIVFIVIISIIRDLFEKDEKTIIKNNFIFIILSGESFLNFAGLVAYIIVTYKKITIVTIEGFFMFIISVILITIIGHELSKIFSNVFLK